MPAAGGNVFMTAGRPTAGGPGPGLVAPAATLAAIEELIAEYLSAGIRASDEIVHYALSSLGADGPNDLARILRDECDESGMTELLLHPSPELSAAIEPLVPTDGMGSHERTLLAAGIARRVPSVPVSFAAFDVDGCISLTPERVERFLAKLALDRAVRAVEKPLPSGREGARLAAAAAAIRRNRPPAREGVESFLGALALGLAGRDRPDDRGIHDTVAFACAVLAARELPVEEALAAEWNAMEKIIAESERFAALSRRYSMEYLMSRRVQPPAMGADEARRRMALLDLVARTGLGRPLPAGPSLVVRDITLGPGGEGLDEIIEDF